jgi:hypothetical protein
LCFATISLTLAKRLHLPRIPISPARDFAQVSVTVKGAIRHVAYAGTDVDGHQMKRVLFYAIPDQGDDVILGRLWMDAEKVTTSPSRGELTIGTSGLVVRERGLTHPLRQEAGRWWVTLLCGLSRAERRYSEEPLPPLSDQ